MSWRWTARRMIISVFLIGHLTALILWNLPVCPIRDRTQHALAYYMMPLGLWQYWGMFAPDPMRDSLTLEAEAIDAKGMRHNFAFAKVADYSKLGGIPRFRNAKYAANLNIDEFAAQREFAARHVVRRLGLAADAFPVDVQLFYQVRSPPPLGQPADPMIPTKPRLISSYRFPNLREVLP